MTAEGSASVEDDRLYFFHTTIAGRRIEIECLIESTALFFKDYLSRFDSPDFVVRASAEALERELSNAVPLIPPEAAQLGNGFGGGITTAEPYLILRGVADELFNYNTLLIHGAAIDVDGKCYIFIAPSGTGKSTHARNWLRMVKGASIVNGDKPFVNVASGLVYGSPWCGKEGMGSNTVSKLAAIVSLERGNTNTIRRVSFKEFLPSLIQQCYVPQEGRLATKAYQLMAKLSNTPCYRLRCNMDPESALIAYKGVRECGMPELSHPLEHTRHSTH